MIAKILPILVLLVASHQEKVEPKPVEIQKPQTPQAPAKTPPATPQKPEKPALGNDKPLSGVDPNKISCDPNGMIYLLLPHFSDCSKFYMCVHGEEVEFSCAPGGLYFDFALQTCNWAWATECILRDPPYDIDDGSGEGSLRWLSDEADKRSGAVGTLTGDAVANSIRPTSLEYSGPSYNGALNCKRADSASRLMPYKGDCQRYWHCASGVAKTAYCSDGLQFNERTQQCDFEANVKCLVEQEDELKNEFILSK